MNNNKYENWQEVELDMDDIEELEELEVEHGNLARGIVNALIIEGLFITACVMIGLLISIL